MADALFKVGDAVLKGGVVAFIDSACKDGEGHWIYGIQYVNVAASRDGQFVGGGNSFWWGEEEFKRPQGVELIQAELWRRWRDCAVLESKLALLYSEAEKLQFALKYLEEADAMLEERSK